jgi:phosphatidate cytidylyltransferase
MSSAHQATGFGGHPAPKKNMFAGRNPNELLMRVLYGVLLAGFAVGITLIGGYLFAGFVGLAALAAAREWHRMVGAERYGREWIVTSAAILLSLVAIVAVGNFSLPFELLLAGAFFAGAVAARRGTSVVWNALGPLYIGIPACALVALRQHTAHAEWIVLGIFLVIWTADTGALAAGRIFGGPKLIPSLSPGKTWSGLVGGLLLPALIAGSYVGVFGGSLLRGFILGFVLAAAGHGGDLFESWVKRRVGRKDSGSSIPGHGGVLDRLDSTLFVAPLAATLIFVFGVSQLFGVHT